MPSSLHILRPSFALVGAALTGGLLLGAGCGSSSSPPVTSTSAAVEGPVDMHCTVNDMEIKQAIGMCVVVGGTSTTAALSADVDGGGDASDADASDASTAGDANTVVASDGGAIDSSASDGGAIDGGTNDAAAALAACGGSADYGCTMYNAEGDDDDCKYHVTWKSTAVKENAGVTFYVTAIRRADGMPATGAAVQLEVYLNAFHPTPSLNIPNTESPGGNYKVGPVLFDAPGKWTVRFHFYEMCSDAPEDSPHGHAAFFVDVP